MTELEYLLAIFFLDRAEMHYRLIDFNSIFHLINNQVLLPFVNILFAIISPSSAVLKTHFKFALTRKHHLETTGEK